MDEILLYLKVMSKLSFLLIAVLAIILIPMDSFAWGPGVHIGVSLSILGKLPDYLKILLMGNINEFLYGSLAPDFIVGKAFSNNSRHSHNWNVAFKILENSVDERERAFAYGYLSHLAADAVAHGILVNEMDKKLKNARHTFMEMVADNTCPATYKQLANQVLKRYNRELDDNFKRLVDSVLFSFGVSKFIFRSMVKISLGRKPIKRVMLTPKLFEVFSLDLKEIRGYVELSKQFSLNVLIKGMDSPVVKISAISR